MVSNAADSLSNEMVSFYTLLGPTSQCLDPLKSAWFTEWHKFSLYHLLCHQYCPH